MSATNELRTPETAAANEGCPASSCSTFWIMSRHEEIMELMGTDPDAVADMLVAWETELSKVMPPDFKDWWQNSKTEWPLVARTVIESLREREDIAWGMLSNTKDMPSNEV